jgi:transcriptional regulator GlxA family with amidase domain
MGKSLGLIIFPQFETLDTYGVIGLIATRMSGDFYDVTLISSSDMELVTSTSNVPTFASLTIDEAVTRKWDVLMIPGGIGFEDLVKDDVFLGKLKQLDGKAQVVFTVCVGSLMLAATGVLDGIPATTNKQLYCEWTPKYPKVNWVHKARWVHHGRYLCSSGVSAGMVFISSMIKLTVGCCVVFVEHSIYSG